MTYQYDHEFAQELQVRLTEVKNAADQTLRGIPTAEGVLMGTALIMLVKEIRMLRAELQESFGPRVSAHDHTK